MRVPWLHSGAQSQAVCAGQFRVRAPLILLLVLLTLCGQSLALTSQEESHHAPDHCCLLCHLGPLPFLQTTVAATLTPIFQAAWLAPTSDFEAAHQMPVFAGSPRAPPAA
jgi:hypothetical protein